MLWYNHIMCKCVNCLKLFLRWEMWPMYFGYLFIISIWKNAWPHIWTNLNILYPRIPYTQSWIRYAQWCFVQGLVKTGPVVLEKKIFKLLNFVIVFSLFCNYLPMEKRVTLHFNKFESPIPKDFLCQVWLCQDDPWEVISKFRHYIFAVP